MRKNDFDTKLIVYRSRKIFLLVAVVIMTLIFTLIIMKNSANDFPWYVLVLPLSGLGALFLLMPVTETWEYKPWQAKPRRIEQQER